jgi:MFS family permease
VQISSAREVSEEVIGTIVSLSPLRSLLIPPSLASLFCALAQTLLLTLARIVQGFGAAGIMAITGLRGSLGSLLFR